MKRFSWERIGWEVALGVFLVVLSFILYFLHYILFHDLHHILIYLVGDLAFLPVEVLIVTLIIHKLLSEREKISRLDKMNMVIGAFFSKVGTSLLTYLSDLDPKLDEIKEKLIVTNDWSDEEFDRVNKILKSYDYGVQIQKINLDDLRNFLTSKRDFLLRLLENPSLLEHESFTELLRAVFHLEEELSRRSDMGQLPDVNCQLPDTDCEHLAGDIKRAYTMLVHQWLDYMKYLKDSYPYMFSFAMRTNPFDASASPVVT